MTLKELSHEQFGQLAKASIYKSFMQSLEMANLLSQRGATCHFLGLEHEGEIKVAALLFSLPMTGGLRMEINSGPFASDQTYLPDFYRALQTYAKQKGALELLVKPYDTYQTFNSEGQPLDQERPELIRMLTNLGYQHDGLMTGYPDGEPDWHYVKDLTDLTPQNLLNSFSKKGKPLLKKAKTFGIKLRALKRDELDMFKTITSATSDRREYSDKSLDYYQAFYDSFGEACQFMVATLNFQTYLDNLQADQAKLGAKIQQLEERLAQQGQSTKVQNQLRELGDQYQTFEVRKAEARDFIATYGSEDITLAASLFIYTDQEAVYLFSGSYPEFNKFYAPALLQEYVMLESLKRGITSYNFLGITGNFDGSDGVLRFKQNFQGYIVRKMGTFRYYPSPLKYKLISGLKRLLGR